MSESSSPKAEVKDGVDVENGVGGGRVVDDVAADTWLIGMVAFSVGFPFLSKKVSAILATSAELMSSTSLPMISRILGGIDFSKCSLWM